MRRDDIVFRRVRGRIIPIKRKENDSDPQYGKGATKIVAGSTVGLLGVKSASKDLKKSFNLFKESAEFRSLSKITNKKTDLHSKLLKASAKYKTRARKFRNISKMKFGLATGLASVAISSGINNFFKRDSEIKDEVANVVGTAASSALIYYSAKRFKLRASNIDDLFQGFTVRGRKLTKAKIKKMQKAAFRADRKKRGTQFDFGF